MVLPERSPLLRLRYGRIQLDARMPPVHVDPGDRETGLVCLRGSSKIRVGTERFEIGPYDTVYVPRDTHFMVAAARDGVDIAEISAPVDARYVAQWTRFTQATSSPERWWHHGDDRASRGTCILLGEQIAAGRLLLGVTVARMSGQRWPPLACGPGLEVASLYVNLPNSTCEIDIDDGQPDPTVISVAREGDLVIGPHGWRPRQLASDESITMLWMLAADQEGRDRRLELSGAPAFARNVS